MEPTLTTPVLTVTASALGKVLDLRAGEDDPAAVGLRVVITGFRGADFTYDLSFQALSEIAEDDNVSEQGDLMVIVPAESVMSLRGATLDLPSDSAQSGLVLRNPNKPDPLAGVHLELTGELPEKVSQLLDEVINPALAAHGGFARLVGVEDTTVFVTMGGGCQGCAVSAMTLRDGIRRSILQHVPEVTDVIDATDHAAGDRPYYS
jgi:Fe/S biogenesis protein NfuA